MKQKAIETFGGKTYFVKSNYHGPVKTAFDSFERAKSVAQKKGRTYFVYTMKGRDIEVVWTQEKENNMKRKTKENENTTKRETIKIKEDVKLPGTDIVLEKGDTINLVEEDKYLIMKSLEKVFTEYADLGDSEAAQKIAKDIISFANDWFSNPKHFISYLSGYLRGR